MSPDFDQDPVLKVLELSKSLGTGSAERRYQMQAAAREAAFECPESFLLSGMIGRRFPIPCVFLETASSPNSHLLFPLLIPFL